jgi:hypothetical protein
MNLDELYDLGQGLIDSYVDRNALFQNIDRMFRKEWDFPPGTPDWVLKVVSTDPADAITTTVRTFATVRPRFKILPMLPNEDNRKRANEIETALAYNFHQAGRRNDAKVEWDVMLSASMYAEVAGQVIYLPYQEKILKAMGKDTRRVKAARRFGDFAFIIHNPANIYPEWSEYGLEGVLSVRVQAWEEFVKSWGNLAEKFEKPSNGAGGYLDYVTVFDYYNYETRCVWAVCNSTTAVLATPTVTSAGIKILEEENKLGFIPYAIRRWGNSLTADTDKRVMPLLQSVYESGQWDMLNVMKSLDASLAIKRAAQPQFAAEVPPGQDIVLDYTDPVGSILLPPGTRNFTPLPSQSMDQRLSAQKNEMESSIWQTSIPRILQTMDFKSGTAYSAANMIMSQAANSLAPYKILGEGALAEIAHLMLCWVKYYGKEYDKDASLYGKYDDKTNAGKEVYLKHDTIDPDKLQLEVILTADMPVDKLQQINGAVMMYQNFRVPQDELLEDLGLGDPADMSKRRDLEDYKNTYIQADLKRIAMQPDLEAQQQSMQMQMEAQQAQQSQAMEQEAAAREQEAQIAAAQQGGTPAQDQMGGMGMNPAAGGMPPVNMARGQA